MAATKAQVNWSSVTFNSVQITRVTTGGFGLGGSLLKLAADVDVYPSVVALASIDPHASFTSADVGPMMALVPGTTATLVATLKDAKAQTGGDVTFTMANCVFENADSSGAHAAFASSTGSWMAFAPDGITPPLVITRA
jgi:hypothetical protein